jgi:hypothetical protein
VAEHGAQLPAARSAGREGLQQDVAVSRLGRTLADRYGLQFGEPEWLPGIISRYGLTAPR